MNAPVDIAVVGAGAAGIAAAVTAARAGAKTLLLDARPAPGGTGGFSGLTTLCGLYDDSGNFLNDGFAREFAEAIAEASPVRMGKVFVLPYRPEKFRAVAEKLVAAEPNLKVAANTTVSAVSVEAGRITQINDLAVNAVIDCSGTAEVANAAGLETLATDETTQASAVVFPLCHVTRALTTASEMAQVLLPLARARFAPLHLQLSLNSGEFTAKFAGTPEQVPQLISFLRANIAGFEHCATPLSEFPIQRRAGRMIVGEYVLSGADVLAGRKFPDAVARGAWPIEQWNKAGVAHFRYLPDGTHYEIPARALRAARVTNLFMAGKTISADGEAIASARVMGCCLATGAAAGVLAADVVNSGRIG